MEHLHVDDHLAAVVFDDHDADGTAAGLKGLLQAFPKVGLVKDGEGLLDVAGIGHGNNVAVLEVKDAVLLQDGAAHGLDNNAGGRVVDGRGLLVELLGEEVDAQVAVLAGGGRGRDADDLGGAALEVQDVADPDVVAGDGN